MSTLPGADRLHGAHAQSCRRFGAWAGPSSPGPLCTLDGCPFSTKWIFHRQSALGKPGFLSGTVSDSPVSLGPPAARPGPLGFFACCCPAVLLCPVQGGLLVIDYRDWADQGSSMLAAKPAVTG